MNSNFSKWSIAVAFLLIFCFAFYHLRVGQSLYSFVATRITLQSTSVASGTSQSSVSTNISEEGVVCHEHDEYFVITKSSSMGIGTDIIVRDKRLTTTELLCRYKVQDGDFEIKNKDAEYFLAVSDHFLILDSGTAPSPRILIIYDLQTKTNVYTDRYAKPFTSEGLLLTYWSPSKEKVTPVNCPNMTENTRQGLGSLVETHLSLSLSTFIRTPLGESRCVATQ